MSLLFGWSSHGKPINSSHHSVLQFVFSGSRVGQLRPLTPPEVKPTYPTSTSRGSQSCFGLLILFGFSDKHPLSKLMARTRPLATRLSFPQESCRLHLADIVRSRLPRMLECKQEWGHRSPASYQACSRAAFGLVAFVSQLIRLISVHQLRTIQEWFPQVVVILLPCLWELMLMVRCRSFARKCRR